MSKTHLLLGVLGVATAIAVVYAAVKKINNSTNK
jgi:hypothetical protein